MREEEEEEEEVSGNGGLAEERRPEVHQEVDGRMLPHPRTSSAGSDDESSSSGRSSSPGNDVGVRTGGSQRKDSDRVDEHELR